MFRIDLHLSSLHRPAGLACAVLSCCIYSIGMVHASSLPQTIQVDTGKVGGVPGTSTPDVMAFRGIPFAAPPVGDLRWKPPVAPAKWTGVRKADHFSASCIQPIRDGTIPGKSPNPNAPYDSWEFIAHGAISED
jgi:hypothetical protein